MATMKSGSGHGWVRLLTRAMLAGTALAGAAVIVPTATMAQDAEATQAYDIPAGSLADALNQFAQQSGLQLNYEASLTEGRTSSGLRGRFSRREALSRLLAGTNLAARPTGTNSVTIAQATTGRLDLDPLQVRGSTVSSEHERRAELERQRRLAEDGRDEDADVVVNARVDSQLAVFGDLPARETPVSVRDISSEEIAQRGATSLAGILYSEPSYTNLNGVTELGSGLTGGDIRGFAVSRYFTNGLPLSINAASLPAEAVERVEVLRGVAGFNFGFLSPGGAINTITKSPTGRERTSLTIRKQAEGPVAGHFENEGVLTDALSYRVNLAGSVGDTYASDTDTRRLLAAVALKYDLGEATRLYLDGYVQDWDTNGHIGGILGALDADGRLLPNQGARHRPLIGPSYDDVLSYSLQARITHDFSDSLSLAVSAQYLYFNEKFDIRSVQTLVLPASGVADAAGYIVQNLRKELGGSARLKYEFSTGAVRHTLTLTGQYDHTIAPQRNFFTDTYRYSIYTGPLDPIPPAPDVLPLKGKQRSNEYGLALAYSLEPTDWLRLLTGLRYSDIRLDSLDPITDQRLSTTGGDKFTPFVGAMVDATNRLSLYANYAQALENGGIAPDDATNAGEQLPPIVSQQYEAGFKWDLFEGRGQLDGAVFQIEQPSQYYLGPGTPFRQGGLTRQRGAELVLSGTVLPRLKVSGGMQYLDGKFVRASDPSIVGNRLPLVPKWQVALSGEYALAAVPGLTLSASVYSQSRSNLELPNTIIGNRSYAKFDLGAAYDFELSGRKWNVAARVDNVFDKRYTTGYSQLGAPRLLYLALGVEF